MKKLTNLLVNTEDNSIKDLSSPQQFKAPPPPQNINGTRFDDIIFGTVYDDTINGIDGNDEIYGDSGLDSINGGRGNDYLNGGDGRDSLGGGDGNDTLVGWAGDDSLYGGQGTDTLYGNEGVDSLVGAADNDFLYGGLGDDYLNGQDGDDVLNGNEGNDSLQGAYGNDRLNGDSGDDIVNGQFGNDVLFGDTGRDKLNGGEGADTMFGGLNDDTYEVDNLLDVVYEASGGGIDTIKSTVNYSLGNFQENLIQIGDANSFGYGNSLANIIIGNSGNNTISGGDGNDLLDGEDGADNISGGDGKDTIILNENIASSDTVAIQNALHSSVTSYDTVSGFSLGLGGLTAGEDNLFLYNEPAVVANNKGTDGINFVNLRSHAITKESLNKSSIPRLADGFHFFKISTPFDVPFQAACQVFRPFWADLPLVGDQWPPEQVQVG